MRLKSFRDMNPYVVGIASVLVLVSLTGAAFAVGLLGLLEKTYEVRAHFSDASGLRSGDTVRIAGVKVGRVTSVSADRQSGRVDVTFLVNQGVELAVDTTRADIILETLLGARSIRLSTDLDTGRCCIEDEDEGSEARLIPLERTSTPYDLFELTRTATDNIEALDTGQLNQVIGQLADITDGKEQTVQDLIRGVEAVSGAINQRDVQLRQLLDRADQLSGTLAEKDRTIVALIDQSRQILDLLADRRQSLATALGEGSEAVALVSDLIAQHQGALDQILTTLDPTLQLVDRHRDSVHAGLAIAGPAFLGQAMAGTHGPWLDIFVMGLGPDVYGFVCRGVLGLSEERCGL